MGSCQPAFGHLEINGDEDESAASATSFRSYYRSIGELADASFLDIADAIDVIAAHEMPDRLDASSDEHDDAFVVTAANPEWLLVHEAAHRMGVSDQTASKLARDGVLEARLAYLADGDREPPGLRWALSTAAVDAWAARRRNGIAVLTAGEKVLHLDRNVVRRLAADPESGLTLRTIEEATRPFLDRGEVTNLLATILGAITDVLGAGGAMSSQQLRDRFVAHVTTSPDLVRIFANPKKMPRDRLNPWVAQFLAVGAVRRLANGRLRLADDSQVGGGRRTRRRRGRVVQVRA